MHTPTVSVSATGYNRWGRRAGPLAGQGISPVAGFVDVIGREILAASWVVVAWSEHSVDCGCLRRQSTVRDSLRPNCSAVAVAPIDSESAIAWVLNAAERRRRMLDLPVNFRVLIHLSCVS